MKFGLQELFTALVIGNQSDHHMQADAAKPLR